MTSGPPAHHSASGSRDASHPDAVGPDGRSLRGAGDDRDRVGGGYWPDTADDGPGRADGRYRGRRHPRYTTGGADGNERLTTLTETVLLMLFAAEGVTILSVRRLPRLARCDLAGRAGRLANEVLAGRAARWRQLTASVLAGLLLAVLTIHWAGAWAGLSGPVH